MKHLILALILLIPTGSFAHNMVYLDADSITSSTVLIRAIEVHNEFGVGSYFQLGSGSNLDIDIDLQGDSGGCCNYVTGGFNSNSYSSLKIKFDGGTGNRAELDYDYTGLSTYHHLDIDIDGASNAVYLDDMDSDHSNTSYEIDIDGDSNKIYPTIGGTQHATKVDITGNSNTIYTWTQYTGDMATGRTALYSGDANTYAIWISVTGSNNKIRARTINTAKTKITLAGTGNHVIRQYGGDANSWMYNSDGGIIDLSIDGSTNNEIGYTGSGSGNTVIIDLDGACSNGGCDVDLWQYGGNNRFEMTVTGSTDYMWSPAFIQSGDNSYCATVNLSNLTSGDTSTINPATGGCS